MIVDTNVLLRTLDRDPGAQGRAARARVRAARGSGERLTVLSATVLEVACVLESESAGYGWDRTVVAGAVEAIADDPAFEVERGAALRVAAASYRTKTIDLHDCLLSALATARSTKVLSFDNDLRRLGSSEAP